MGVATGCGCKEVYISATDPCHRKFCRTEILSRRQFFLGNSVLF